jgi:hypothetical protein
VVPIKVALRLATNKEATEPRVLLGKSYVATVTWLTAIEYLCHK